MFRGAFRIATVAGIGIFVHVTFGLLLLYVGWQAAQGGQGPLGIALVEVLVLCVFVCVALHELGHALMARHFGVRTRSIVLYPIGGVASLERMPAKPVQELLVAIAGPAVNVVIALLLGLLFVATPLAFDSSASVMSLSNGASSILSALLAINVFLVVFNAIPAFPMDGGRVLRALLSMGFGRPKATQVAAVLGQVIAGLFLVLGLLGANPILIIIAVFVFFAARAEARGVAMEDALSRVRVGDVMLTEFRTLDTDETLEIVGDLLLTRSQQDFPVAHDGHYVGLLARNRFPGVLRERDARDPVSSVVDINAPVCDPFEPLVGAIARLNTARATAAAVVHEDLVVGLLTPEALAGIVPDHAGGVRRARPTRR